MKNHTIVKMHLIDLSDAIRSWLASLPGPIKIEYANLALAPDNLVVYSIFYTEIAPEVVLTAV